MKNNLYEKYLHFRKIYVKIATYNLREKPLGGINTWK